jgi:hypothetical protein
VPDAHFDKFAQVKGATPSNDHVSREQPRKHRKREQKPDVRVSINRSLVPLGAGKEPLEPHVGFHVRNAGLVDVFFKEFCSNIQVKNWDHRYVLYKPLSSVEFPAALKAGDSLDLVASLPKLQAELRKAGKTGRMEIRGCIADAVGREFKSDWLTVDV